MAEIVVSTVKCIQWGFGFAGDICTFYGAFLLARESLFREKSKDKLEKLRRGLSLLLAIGKPIVDGVSIDNLDDSELVETRRLVAEARAAYRWLLGGFASQLIARGIEVAEALLN